MSSPETHLRTIQSWDPAKLASVRKEQKRQNKFVRIYKKINFARNRLISVNKFPRLRARDRLLKIQNCEGNTEKRIIGQKYNEDFANLMWYMKLKNSVSNWHPLLHISMFPIVHHTLVVQGYLKVSRFDFGSNDS